MTASGQASPESSTRRRWRIATAVIAVVAFGLGFYGYWSTDQYSFLSTVYNTVGLFTRSFTRPENSTEGLSWSLEVARFLAPLATAMTIIQLIAALLRDHFDVLWARFRRGHAVVVGLGPVGIATARRILDGPTKVRVVVIEHDATMPHVRSARALGVPVVIGDATMASVRRRAGVPNAGWFIWTPSEWIEGDTVVHSLHAELRSRSRRWPWQHAQPRARSKALIRVRDLGLCTMFRYDVLVPPEHSRDGIDTDFFNEAENTAQRLLWRVARGFEGAGAEPVELWILGSGPFTDALVVQAVRNWWGRPERPELTIRVFAGDADAVVARIRAEWPEVDFIRLEAHTGPADLALRPEFVARHPDPHGVFVLVDNEEHALLLGLRVVAETAAARVAVAATMRYPPVATNPRIVYFDSVTYGLESDAFMFDTYELLGRVIHQHYNLRPRVRSDRSLEPETDPHGVGHEWPDLDAIWQESNRRAARDMVPLLRAAGFDLVRLSESRGPDHVVHMSKDQIELMAKMEHDAWREFMEQHEYRKGPRDTAEKTRPGLVKWSRAPAWEKSYTRQQVADYPQLLPLLGYCVVACDEHDRR